MVNFRGIPECPSLSKYGTWACRCEKCKALMSDYQRKRRVEFRQRSIDEPQSIVHGKRSSYIRGCRCPDCTAATVAYQKTYREQVRARLS